MFLGILGFSYVSKKRPIISCNPSEFIQSKSSKYYIHPVKVTVKPWHGEHHVFAIFMIPDGYVSDRLLTVKIEGDTFCGVLQQKHTTDAEGIVAQPGYYLMKGYVNTRVGLWWISQGKVNQLRQPDNWTVGYVKKE